MAPLMQEPDAPREQSMGRNYSSGEDPYMTSAVMFCMC